MEQKFFQSTKIDSIAINFENCEQIVIPIESVNRILITGTDEEGNIQGIYIALDQKADFSYSCMGYDSPITSFERIQSRADIVSIDLHEKTGEELEFIVPYIEDERGFNAVEKCWISQKGELHIEIKE